MGTSVILDKHEVIVDRELYDKLLYGHNRYEFIKRHKCEIVPDGTFWTDTTGKKYKPDYAVSIDSISFFGRFLDEAIDLAEDNECIHCGRIYNHLIGCIGKQLEENSINMEK